MINYSGHTNLILLLYLLSENHLFCICVWFSLCFLFEFAKFLLCLCFISCPRSFFFLPFVIFGFWLNFSFACFPLLDSCFWNYLLITVALLRNLFSKFPLSYFVSCSCLLLCPVSYLPASHCDRDSCTSFIK